MPALSDMPIGATLAAGLSRGQNRWSMGVAQASVSFQHDETDVFVINRGLVRATHRGGIRIENAEAIVTLADGGDPARRGGVVLCLPKAQARRAGRRVLTPLGPDLQAIRPRDRKAMLFDLGLGLVQVDLCIRVVDPVVISALTSVQGQSVHREAREALGLAMLSQPHWVAVTGLGRIEDYRQRVVEVHEEYPAILSGLTRPVPQMPIPEGLIPCGGFYPVTQADRSMGRVSGKAAAASGAERLRVHQLLADLEADRRMGSAAG